MNNGRLEAGNKIFVLNSMKNVNKRCGSGWDFIADWILLMAGFTNKVNLGLKFKRGLTQKFGSTKS